MDGWLVGISPETLNLFFFSFFFLFIRPLFCNRYEWLFGLFVFVFTAFSWWPAVFSFPSFSRCRPASRFPKSDYYQVSRECTLCCCLLLSFFFLFLFLPLLSSIVPFTVAFFASLENCFELENFPRDAVRINLCFWLFFCPLFVSHVQCNTTTPLRIFRQSFRCTEGSCTLHVIRLTVSSFPRFSPPFCAFVSWLKACMVLVAFSQCFVASVD